RWALGNRPALEHTVELQTEVPVQAACLVPLDDEGRQLRFGRRARGARRRPAAGRSSVGLGRALEVAPRPVFAEGVGPLAHVRPQALRRPRSRLPAAAARVPARAPLPRLRLSNSVRSTTLLARVATSPVSSGSTRSVSP